MDMIKNFIDSYFDFHYGLGLAVATVICFILLLIKKVSLRTWKESHTKKEVLSCVACSLYIVIILGSTLFSREIGENYRIKTVPFWSYYHAIVNKDNSLIIQIFYNILVFIPYGVLIPKMWSGMQKCMNTVLGAFFFSMLIEMVQLILKLGLFEFDDIIHNVVGAMIGYGMWKCHQKKR